MTPEEFATKIEAIRQEYKDDPETRHAESDALLCEVLTSLGYEAGVKLFEQMPKWYA